MLAKMDTPLFMIASPWQQFWDNVNIQGNEIMIIFPNCKENKPVFLLSQNLQESRKECIG
jgi:hypothetical protein